MKNGETTLDDVLEAVNTGFQNMQDTIGADVSDLKTRMISVEGRLTSVETRLTSVESEMVTKDYLDEKLGVTNGRLASLVNVLERKKVVTEEDKRHIYL